MSPLGHQRLMAARAAVYARCQAVKGAAGRGGAAGAAALPNPFLRATGASRAQQLSTSAPPSGAAKNHVYNPIRNTDTFNTYLSVSSSSRTPLLTLWTASWCPSCRTVAPLLRSLVESGVGAQEGGVALAEVEFDAPDMMGADPNPAMTYMITSIPTLLSFDAGEAQTATKVTDVRMLSDRQFLTEWIVAEARRHGGRGGGGGGGGSLFGGLFGSSR